MRNQTTIDKDGDTIVIAIDIFSNVSKGKKVPNILSQKVIDLCNHPQVVAALIAIYDSPLFCEDEYWKKRYTDTFNQSNEYKIDPDFNWAPCPNILSWRSTKNVFPGYTIGDLKKILKEFPNTKNILIAGEAWEMCIRNRPLGLLKLIPFLKDTDINIICDFDIINTMEKSNKTGNWFPENETHVWEQVAGRLYHLPKKHYDRYLDKYVYMYYDKYPWEKK